MATLARWALAVFVCGLLAYQFLGPARAPDPTPVAALRGAPLDAPPDLSFIDEDYAPGDAARAVADRLRAQGKLGGKVYVDGELRDATGVDVDQLAGVELPEVPAGQGEFTHVTFGVLAGFDYTMPEEPPREATPEISLQVPPLVTALNGMEISVQGFMVPIRMERGEVKSFLLVRNQALCCYGIMPKLNEWIYVTMREDETTRFIADLPLTAFGTLEIGEQWKRGKVISLYRMEAERVKGFRL